MTRRNKPLGCAPAQSLPVGHRLDRGSALVEFAFVLIILLTLIFGIMDFSLAMYADHFVSDAAREATRYASVHGSTSCPTWGSCPATASDITSYVQGMVPAGMYVNSSATTGNPGFLLVTTTWPGTTGSGDPCTTSTQPNKQYPGCIVQVQVQYTYGFNLPFVTSLAKTNMSSTTQVVIAQ